MQIQLTKTKSITIGGGASTGGRRFSDVVGIDLFGGDERGFPAVRITSKKGQTKVLAAGFVPPPEGELPTTWEEASKNPTWSLPADFQAPHAAFAVSSPETFVIQTTLDAVKSDITSGAHQGEEPGAAAAKTRRFGIRREPKKPEAKKPPEQTASKVDLSTLEPGRPISNGGTRFVMCPMNGSDGFVMEAGMPEYQVLWLSRLLPEGRRPTVASIQPRPSALTAEILADPEFIKAGGTGLALYLEPDRVMLAGFKNRDLVLWRRCQSVSGLRQIRAALLKGLGVEEEMLDGILNDNLIDPRPVLEGVLQPLMDELAVSRDYLSGKLSLELKSAFIVGVGAGVRYWSAIAEERAHLGFIECKPFAGLEGAVPENAAPGVFSGALGAALALMSEGES